MSLVYMIPFFIGTNKNTNEKELQLVENCIRSLEKCEYEDLIFYNQGGLTNEELFIFLSDFDIKFTILGTGINEGILSARYKSIKFIDENYENIKYIAEIDIDMVFTKDWDKPLIEYLDSSDEPMISPRVITFDRDDNIYKAMGISDEVYFPYELAERIDILNSYKEDIITEGVSYPIIHKFEILKSINPFDIGFLTGKEGYEGDSILLGYNYYIGTKNNWRPKICFKSCIYHEGIYGSFKVKDSDDVKMNLEGLKLQYGAYGQKELARIYLEDETFQQNYENMIKNISAYNIEISEYKEIKEKDIKEADDIREDLYGARFFKVSDRVKDEIFLKIPTAWWSRFYEYAWASEFVEKEDVCLDAACGIPHPFKFYLANQCKEVEAFDIAYGINENSKILESLKEHFELEDIKKAESVISKINFRCRNIKNTGYPEDYFDKIYCISLFHLLKGNDVTTGLTELKRILKKGGLLLITVDSPTINVKKLVDVINKVGLVVKGDLNLNKEKDSLMAKRLGNLSCFRIVVTKE